MRRTQKWSVLLAFGLGIFVSCGWIISAKNGFLMDDYTTIVRGIFESPSQLFTLFPQMKYNDRPVGIIFVSLLYHLFGLNFQGYHFLFVAMHLVNMMLVYKIAKKLFAINQFDTIYAPLLAAAIFGIYPQSIMALQWISAVFDMLCCFFVLCSLYAYLKIYDSERYSVFYSIIVFVTYVLSLRAKEMSLLLPVFLIILDRSLKKHGVSETNTLMATCAPCIWMAFYTARLLSFPSINEGPYKQSFHVISLVRSLIRYIGLYFDVENMNMVFASYNTTMSIGIVTTGFIVVYAILLWKKGTWVPFVSLLGIGILLAPVLTMSESQHKLYLYIPSAFVAILFSALLSLFARNFNKHNAMETLSCTLILVLTLLHYTPGAVQFKYWWCTMSQRDQEQLSQIYRMGDLPLYCNIYVRGADKDYNVISPYGPGDSIRTIYGRNDITCTVVEEFPDEPLEPYLLIDYVDGSFYKTESQEAYGVVIRNMSYNRVNGDIQIGVECSPIYPSSQIEVNGKIYPTTIGETFISTAIAESELETDKPVSVMVIVPDLGIQSAAQTIEIE